MGGASSTPASVVFTGLPASGKSSLVCTIADAAEKRKEPLRSADAYGDFLSHATLLGTHYPTNGLAHLELVVKSSGGTLHLSEQGGGTDKWRRQMNQMLLKQEFTTCCCFVVDASLRDTRVIQEAHTLLRALARDAPASVLFVLAATKSDVDLTAATAGLLLLLVEDAPVCHILVREGNCLDILPSLLGGIRVVVLARVVVLTQL